MLIITVHDRVAGTWSNPTAAMTRESAVRDFRTACTHSGSVIYDHPEDFELYILGEWITHYDPNRFPTMTVLDKPEFVESGSKPGEKSGT